MDHILERALEAAAGAALVIDARGKVLLHTPGAQQLVPDFARLHHDESLRSALAAGAAAVVPVRIGDRWIKVRAEPLGPRREPSWLLRVTLDSTRGKDVVDFHGLVTGDPAMKRLFEIITKVARSNARVLVRGESGSGKELVARAIHTLSSRASGPFRAINCAALPASLLESELFGHVRGAFTGAVRDNPGHFRLAAGGTLFLDEVGEMPLDLQAKLLRVVETGTVIPVGGRDAIPVDVRIVGATHRSLRAEAEAGRFRADLMYRLRVIPIFLPPLRSRPGDITLLAERALGELSDHGLRKALRLAPDALATMLAHPWPGNVRELLNVMEYAYVTGDGPTVTAAQLTPELLEGQPGPTTPAPAGTPRLNERARISIALEQTRGSRQAAAKLLGLSRSTLWRRMRELDIDVAR